MELERLFAEDIAKKTEFISKVVSPEDMTLFAAQCICSAEILLYWIDRHCNLEKVVLEDPFVKRVTDNIGNFEKHYQMGIHDKLNLRH